MTIPQPPNRYILAGSMKTAEFEARNHKLRRPIGATGRVYRWFTYIGPPTYYLEGLNIKPGDSVLFGYGTTADMIDRFVMQAASRGTKLSDLRIIHK